MMKRMVLAGLLAFSAVPVLAADAAPRPKAPASTDEARVMAGKQIAAQAKAEAAPVRACTCSHGS